MEVVGCSNMSQLWTRSCGEAGWHIQLLSHSLSTKDSKLPIVLYFLAHHFEKALQSLIWLFDRMKAPLTFRNGTRIIRHRQASLHRRWNELKYSQRHGHCIYQRFFWALRKPETCCFSTYKVLLLVITQTWSGQKSWPRIAHVLALSFTHSLLCLLPNTDNPLTADHWAFGTMGVKHSSTSFLWQLSAGGEKQKLLLEHELHASIG